MAFQLRPLALAISLAFTGTSVCAQATNQASEATLPEVAVKGAATRAGTREDLSSTATKTDTPLRDVPASVVVVPKEILRQQSATDMNRALDNVSGVQPVMGGGYGFANNYAIRGMAMRFLRDGYPDGTSQNGYWRTVWDIDRIEVLKGPGSALYGPAQPGGSVNVITKSPLSKPQAEISAFSGSFHTYGGAVDVTGALGSQLQGRFIADVERSDGFRGLSRDIKEFLPTLAIQLADDKTLTLDWDHRDLEITPDNYGLIFNFQRQVVDVPVETRYYSPMNFSEQTIDRFTAKHDWRINNELTMRTAFINDKRDLSMLRNAGGNAGNAANVMTGRNARTQVDDANYTTVQNEFVWKPTTAGIKHTALAGIEYSDTRIDTTRVGYNLPNITNILAPVVPETSLSGIAAVASQGFSRQISARDWGLYLQDQIDLTKQWKVRLGARSDRIRFSDVGLQGGTYREIRNTKTLNTGNIGAVWQPLDYLSVFAGYSTGRFINLSTEPASLNTEPETSNQKEVGVKASTFNGKLDLNVAYFDNERKNYYITLPGALSPTPDGADRTKGWEIDLLAMPIRGLSLLANFTAQKSKVLSNALASNTILGVTNQSIYGTVPTGVAKRSARLWAQYDFAGGWGIGTGVTYRGKTYADNLNLYQVPAYTVWDAGISYKAKKWDAVLSLRNLTDRRYFTNATFTGALPGESRSAMLTIRTRFF